MNAFYVADGFRSPLEDVFVESMLTTATGVDNYPGDSVPSENWPGFAPGGRGVLNTMAPQHHDVSGIVALETKPPVLWVRGTKDAIVSDASMFDLATLGQLGAIPGWPGRGRGPAAADGRADAGGARRLRRRRWHATPRSRSTQVTARSSSAPRSSTRRWPPTSRTDCGALLRP